MSVFWFGDEKRKLLENERAEGLFLTQDILRVNSPKPVWLRARAKFPNLNLFVALPLCSQTDKLISSGDISWIYRIFLQFLFSKSSSCSLVL